MVRVRCVHGDVVKYLVVLLTIQFRGQKHKVEVAVNPRLRHPLILGTNWPAFKILLGVLCVDASCGKEKPEGEAAVRTGEAEPGPAEAAPGERSAVERLILTERDDFPLEQSQDESLRNAFDQVHSIDGRPLQSARPPYYPYFAILKDRLYRVTQDAQSKQDTTQLLVPKSRREMLFQAAHCNPMAGHLGQAATEPFNGPFFLAGHSRECTPVVCGLSWMSVSESPGLPKSAFAPPSANAGPLRKNWYGPHRAIGTVSTRASVCISSGGLCNPIPGGSGAPQHFRKECSGGSVQYDLPGGNPERDSHRSGHGVYVTNHSRTLWVIGN